MIASGDKWVYCSYLGGPMGILDKIFPQNTTDEPLRDLIYVDETRLDSYVRQTGTPDAVVKVPKWTFGFSVAGPKVKGEQQQSSRKRENEEKIELLLKYLKKHDQLAEGRIRSASYFNRPSVFRMETCSVVSVDIPSLRPLENSADTLTLWISSDEADGLSRLFLLQDFQKSDDSAFGAHSAYSSLLLIYEEVISKSLKYQESFVSELRSQELKRVERESSYNRSVTRFSPHSGSESFKNELSLGGETIDMEVDRRVDNQLEKYFPLRNPLDKEIQKRFAVEPVSVLREMGARIVCERNVETLYRVRDVHMERLPGEGRTAIVTFGYPIFVSAL